MKTFVGQGVALFIALVVGECLGQTNRLEMPMVAERLPVANIKLVNKIPAADFRRLPKYLPVFRYTGRPREFSTEGLQMLLKQSPFSGTNAAELLRKHTDPEEVIRFSTERNLDYFAVNLLGGGVISYTHGNDVDLRHETPAYDSIPSFDAISGQVLRHAAIFGVSTNEIERKPDGAIHFHKMDEKTSARGGAIKFIRNRSVSVSRGIQGEPILMNDDKVELQLGVNGRPLKFELKWPVMEPVRTNRVLSASELLKEIKNGELLGGVVNEYPANGIAEIELRDLHIIYYDSKPRRFRGVSTNTDIFPVASMAAVFKSKSGQKTEGVVYGPVTGSR